MQKVTDFIKAHKETIISVLVSSIATFLLTRHFIQNAKKR